MQTAIAAGSKIVPRPGAVYCQQGRRLGMLGKFDTSVDGKSGLLFAGAAVG